VAQQKIRIRLKGYDHQTLDRSAKAIVDEALRTGPRIGLNTAPEPWLSLPWRFWEAGNPFVSRGSGKRG